MSGNGRLSDYIAKYDRQKEAEERAVALAKAKGIELAETIASRVDTALEPKGAENDEWIFLHPDKKSTVRIKPCADGSVTINHGSGAMPAHSLNEGLTELARIVREG